MGAEESRLASLEDRADSQGAPERCGSSGLEAQQTAKTMEHMRQIELMRENDTGPEIRNLRAELAEMRRKNDVMKDKCIAAKVKTVQVEISDLRAELESVQAEYAALKDKCTRYNIALTTSPEKKKRASRCGF